MINFICLCIHIYIQEFSISNMANYSQNCDMLTRKENINGRTFYELVLQAVACLGQFSIPCTETMHRSTSSKLIICLILIVQFEETGDRWGILNRRGGIDLMDLTEMLAGVEQMVLGIRTRAGVMWLMGANTSDGFDVHMGMLGMQVGWCQVWGVGWRSIFHIWPDGP